MKKIGIYKIENIKDNKKYIGQSTNLNMRLFNHKNELIRNKHHNKHLQNSYNKYGKDFFTFEILCECSLEELNDKEKYFIKEYDSVNNGYNTLEGGEDLEDCIKRGHAWMEIRKNIKKHCLICGKETKNGLFRYCDDHKNKCSRCGAKTKYSVCDKCLRKSRKAKEGNPIEITIICELCKNPISKNSNRQKYYENCSKIARRKKQRDFMWNKRHSCND